MLFLIIGKRQQVGRKKKNWQNQILLDFLRTIIFKVIKAICYKMKQINWLVYLSKESA